MLESQDFLLNPTTVEIVGLIGAGKSTILKKMGEDMALYRPESPVLVQLEEEDLLHQLIDPYLSQVYYPVSTQEKNEARELIVEVLFATVRLLQLRWQVDDCSTPDLLAYLDRILHRLMDGTTFAEEMQATSRDQLKSLARRLGKQTNKPGLYVVDRGVIDIFCFIRERISTHLPNTAVHKSLVELSVRLYREVLYLLFLWDEPTSDKLPMNIGELASLKRRVNYYCVYINVPKQWAQGNIQARARSCEVNEEGRVLPTVLRVNDNLVSIYPGIIQSAVFSKKALVHRILHLLKLIPSQALVTRGAFIRGYGAMNAIRTQLEKDLRHYDDTN